MNIKGLFKSGVKAPYEVAAEKTVDAASAIFSGAWARKAKFVKAIGDNFKKVVVGLIILMLAIKMIFFNGTKQDVDNGTDLIGLMDK